MCKIAGLHKIQFYAPNGIFFPPPHCLLLFSAGQAGQLLYFGRVWHVNLIFVQTAHKNPLVFSLGSLKRKNANRKLDIRIYVNLKSVKSSIKNRFITKATKAFWFRQRISIGSQFALTAECTIQLYRVLAQDLITRDQSGAYKASIQPLKSLFK